LILFLHAFAIVIRLCRPGDLRASDRIVAGFRTLLMRPAKILPSAIAEAIDSPAFSQAVTKQKYRCCFHPNKFDGHVRKDRPKQLIDAVVEMKRRNRTWGCKRIAQQVKLAFGVISTKTFSVANLILSLQLGVAAFRRIWLRFDFQNCFVFGKPIESVCVGNNPQNNAGRHVRRYERADSFDFIVHLEFWHLPRLWGPKRKARGRGI
jgi:hypothetical protein